MERIGTHQLNLARFWHASAQFGTLLARIGSIWHASADFGTLFTYNNPI